MFFFKLDTKSIHLILCSTKLNALPVEIQLTDFFFIAGMAMLLAFLASFYPAKKATKVNIIESIKWE